MYVNRKYNIGLRIASAFVLRELYKNNQAYIQVFLNDQLALNSIKDFLSQENQQYIIEGKFKFKKKI